MKNSVRYYRTLYWASSFVAVAALVGCFLLNQRLNGVKRALVAAQFLSRMPDPHEASEHRDQNFEFSIRNYGFEYEGKTGDTIDDSVLFCGAWEKDFAFFMRDYLERRGNKNSVFIDVGCNAGHHSLFLSRYVKQVHAFDPFPPVVERFRKMIERNGFANIEIHPVGLGAKDEELPFFQPAKDNFGTGSFRDHQMPDQVAKTTLRIVRGDEWLAQFKPSEVELIKIDIEGFEESALQGLRQTIEAQRPVIVVEVTRPPGGTIGSLQQLQAAFPDNYQFLVFIADDKTPLNGRYSLQDFEPVAHQFFSGGNQVNLVACPAEKRRQVPLNRLPEPIPRKVH
jgi:FkbM family methyltransferase